MTKKPLQDFFERHGITDAEEIVLDPTIKIDNTPRTDGVPTRKGSIEAWCKDIEKKLRWL